jgi:hypothetical protein
MAEGLASGEADTILDAHADTTYPWIQLHTAAPGAAGTVAVAGNATRKDTSVAWAPSAGGVKATDVDIAWTEPEVDTAEDYTHYTLWTASTAGTFGSSGTVTASAVSATGDTFTITSGGLTLTFVVAS